MLRRSNALFSIASLVFIAAVSAQDAPPVEQSAPDPEPELEEMLADMPTLSDEAEVTSHHVHAFPLVQYKRDGDRKKVKVLNAVVAQGYTHKENDDREQTKILDVPFASLAKVTKNGDETETRVLNAPWTSLVRKKSDGDSTSVKVVKIPLFTLAESETQEDGQFDRKFIKLPIVGALFRHKRTEEEKSVRFLFFRFKKKLNHD